MLVRSTLDPSAPPRMTDDERAAMDAMTGAQVEQNTLEDLDNPPLTEDELGRVEGAGLVRLALRRTGLGADAFAGAFRLDPDGLRRVAAGELRPDPALLVLLTVISREPEAVRRALAA